MNEYITSSQWREILPHPTVSCTYILKTNDEQFINEVVKCPKYCVLTIWHVLPSIFIIESSLWKIRCLRPTFTVIGDFQMQWSDGQKLGKRQLSALSGVSSCCAFFCSYGRTGSVPAVYICVFCSRLVSSLHFPPLSTLPCIFSVLTLLLFLG